LICEFVLVVGFNHIIIHNFPPGISSQAILRLVGNINSSSNLDWAKTDNLYIDTLWDLEKGGHSDALRNAGAHRDFRGRYANALISYHNHIDLRVHIRKRRANNLSCCGSNFESVDALSSSTLAGQLAQGQAFDCPFFCRDDAKTVFPFNGNDHARSHLVISHFHGGHAFGGWSGLRINPFQVEVNGSRGVLRRAGGKQDDVILVLAECGEDHLIMVEAKPITFTQEASDFDAKNSAASTRLMFPDLVTKTIFSPLVSAPAPTSRSPLPRPISPSPIPDWTIARPAHQVLPEFEKRTSF
jgi:hypothetical protein